MAMIWDLIEGALAGIAIYLFFRIFFYLFISGKFTGNEYKKIDGVLHVRHPGGDWMPLKEHQDKHHKKRGDFK